jgi:multidrug resistance efflux pump
LYGFNIKPLYMRGIIPALVCLVTAGAAHWLYQDSPGLTGVRGMAEAEEYTISSTEAGKLVAVEVVLGQRVSRDQVVARLDKGVLEQEIRVAETELQELEAQVPASRKSLDLSGMESDRSFRSDLEKAEVELVEARADCERAHAEVKAVQEEISRQRELVLKRLLAAERMHQLEVQLTALRQIVASCPSRMETIEKRQQAAQKRSDDWRFTGGGGTYSHAKQEQLQPLLLRSSRQKEYLRLLRLRLENLVLRAPVDGYVSKVHAMPGSSLTPGEPLMIIVGADPRQVIAYQEEDRGRTVVAGDQVLMYPRDRSGLRTQGRVTAVAATVSQLPLRFWPAPTRPRWGRQIFIRLDANRSLVPGEAVDVTFAGQDEALDVAPIIAAAESSTPAADATAPLIIPKSLLTRSRFEPSGIIWLEKLQRYLVVSDDTGFEKVNDHTPWLFTVGRDGTVDPAPLVIEGIEQVNDLEGIAAAMDGRIYLIASQSSNKKGILRPTRTIFLVARLSENRLISEGHVYLTEALAEAGHADPSFFASLGLTFNGIQEEPAIEIEGLAWHRGALFLGLKQPLDSLGHALIWKIENPDSLFRRKSLSGAALTLWKKVSLPVEGIPAGISDILPLTDGSLLLTATNTRGGALFLAAVTADAELQVTNLRSFPGLKPEGLCLSPDRRLVVIFDQQQKKPLWMHMELPQ